MKIISIPTKEDFCIMKIVRTESIEQLKVDAEFGHKFYLKGKYAWKAKYTNSKWWNPFDWFRVKVE